MKKDHECQVKLAQLEMSCRECRVKLGNINVESKKSLRRMKQCDNPEAGKDEIEQDG